jgi:hypothetical protein
MGPIVFSFRNSTGLVPSGSEPEFWRNIAGKSANRTDSSRGELVLVGSLLIVSETAGVICNR